MNETGEPTAPSRPVPRLELATRGARMKRPGVSGASRYAAMDAVVTLAAIVGFVGALGAFGIELARVEGHEPVPAEARATTGATLTCVSSVRAPLAAGNASL